MSRCKKLGLGFAPLLAAPFLAMMSSGCPRPIPPPVPGPTPSSADAATTDAASADFPVSHDPFKGQLFNCHLPVVSAQYEAASPRVGDCLASPPLACLEGLLPAYDINTVACLVRDLGFEATKAVLTGTDAANLNDVADNARTFINAEQLGFR
jgi:hypothetical protein